jgi:hypothetical protein
MCERVAQPCDKLMVSQNMPVPCLGVPSWAAHSLTRTSTTVGGSVE